MADSAALETAQAALAGRVDAPTLIAALEALNANELLGFEGDARWSSMSLDERAIAALDGPLWESSCWFPATAIRARRQSRPHRCAAARWG